MNGTLHIFEPGVHAALVVGGNFFCGIQLLMRFYIGDLSSWFSQIKC